MSITVADLLVKLDMDDSDFRRGADRSEGHIRGAFASALRAGAVAAATGAVAGMGAVFESMRGIEDALTPIGTVLGTTTIEFGKMREAILDVAKSSPKSPEELGSAAYMILSAGIMDSTKAALALSDANKLSLAGLGTVAEAAGVITSAMNSWKEENLTSTDAARILFGTILSGKTTLSELSQGFGQIAPLAAQTGVNFKELMAATATLTSTGMPASVAYSGLRAAITNILNPTKDAADMAAIMGINFDSTTLKTRGLKGMLGTIIGEFDTAAAAGYSNVDALTALFGSVEAVNAILALTSEGGSGFITTLGNITEAGGKLDERAKEVSNTLSNRLMAAKNRAMIALSEWGTKGLDWLTAKYNEHRDSINAALDFIREKWFLVFGAVGAFVATHWETIRSTLVNGTMGLVDFFQTHWGTISAVVGGAMAGIRVAAEAVVAWFRDNWPTIRTIAEAVISGVITAVGGLVTWVQTNWPTIQSIIQTGLGALVQAFSGLRDIIGQVVGFIAEHWPTISSVIIPILNAVWQAVLTVATLIGVQFAVTTAFVTFLWRQWGDEIMAVLGFVVEYVVPVIVNLLNIIANVFALIRNIVTGQWGAAWDNVKAIFSNAVGYLVNTLQATVALIWNLVGGIFSAGAQFIWQIIQGMWSVIGHLWSWLSGIPNDIWNVLSGLYEVGLGIGKNLLVGLINGAVSMARRFSDTVWDVATSPIRAVKGYFGFGSPSKLMRQYGQWAMEGFEIGFQDRSRDLNKSALDSFGTVTSASTAISNNSTVANGGPMNVNVNMPPGSNGDDVVRALKQWQNRNGSLPIKVSV